VLLTEVGTALLDTLGFHCEVMIDGKEGFPTGSDAQFEARPERFLPKGRAEEI
jgi:hypothetical protein